MIFRISRRFYIEDRFKTRFFISKKRESSLLDSFDISLIIFFSFSNISPKIDRNRNFARKNIFRKYFEKEDIPGYIYSRRRTTNKEIKRIYRGILGDIFSKRQRNILYAGKMLKIHAYPLPFFLRERTGRLPFSRVALGSGTIAVFPCNLFPFSPPQPLPLCVKALRQSPVRCTRTGRVRKLGLGRYRSSHQFTTSGQRRN